MEDRIFEFEAANPTYLAWETYVSMSDTDKQELGKKWNDYYQSCENSYFGLIFRLATTAFKQKDIQMLNSLGEQARNSKTPKITPPSTYDPEELEKKMQAYFQYKHELTRLKTDIWEHEPAFETKKDDIKKVGI